MFDHLIVCKQPTDVLLNGSLYIAILGTIQLWLMLNWIAKNRTVLSFNCVYLQNVFTNHILNACVKTWFGIK